MAQFSSFIEPVHFSSNIIYSISIIDSTVTLNPKKKHSLYEKDNELISFHDECKKADNGNLEFTF